MKKVSFRKGDICLVKNFQDFGEVKIRLTKRVVKDVYGNQLKNIIWEGKLIDAKHKRLKSILRKIRHPDLVFEKELEKEVREKL